MVRAVLHVRHRIAEDFLVMKRSLRLRLVLDLALVSQVAQEGDRA